MLSFAPLCPDEVTAASELLISKTDLILARYRNTFALHWERFFIIVPCWWFLPVELFLFDVATIPPGPSTDDLPDWWIVVAFANVVAEHLSRLLWLDTGILLIQDSIDLDKHLLVDCVKEIWHFQGFLV